MVNRSGAGSAFARVRGLLLLVLLLSAGVFLLKRDLAAPVPSSSDLGSASIQSALAQLPMSFEANRGQIDSDVKFLAHGSGYGVYLTTSGAVLTFPKHTQVGLTQSGIDMRLQGATVRPELSGADRLPGHSSYLIGNDSSRWLRNVPQFARVQYHGVYPGIDLAFYGKQNKLEYDFEVAPGSDPRQIELSFDGASNVSVASNGDLVLGLDGRDLRFEAPHVYQKSAAGIQTIAGAFVLRGQNSAGFEIGPYDRSRELVIDPVLAFSTYLGGAGDESCTAITGASLGFVPHCPSLTLDSGGHIYVAGATTSPNTGTFAGSAPILVGAMGTADVFVSRISLSSQGGVTTATLDHVTYIGGSGTSVQYPTGVGVDSGFHMYVAGTTNASDFPTTASAFQTTPAAAGNHAFVTKIDPTGSANEYSTYLSGNGVDTAANMAVDSLGRVYVIGTTTSSNFPTTLGALQAAPAATNQFFFSKLDTSQNTVNSLQYSTYIGGSTPANGVVLGGAVSVDANFNVYLAGGTNFTDMGSPNPWIVNAFQASEQGGVDVWAAKLNAPANNTQQYTVAYATYLGGTGDDVAYGVANDGTNTYITGSTTSGTVASTATTTPFQAGNGGGVDAFVAKFGVPAVTGTTQGTVPIDYFSFLGGGAADAGLAIAVDTLALSNARVVGFTDSADFPTASPFQGTSGGARDGFIARLNTTGTSTSTNTSTSSFLGGAGTDIATGIALDAALNTYIAGETSSGNFPLAAALSGGGSLSGGTDAFVTELGPNTSGLSMPQVTPAGATAPPGCNTANPTVSPSPAGVGSDVTFTYYIYNTGDPVSGAIFTDTLGANTTSATVTSCQSTVSNGAISCSLGTIQTSTITSLTTPNSCGASSSIAPATTVTVTVKAPVPATPLQSTSSIGNSASLSFPGGTLASINGSVPLNDFKVTASLAPPSTSSTIPSGGQVNYSVKVTPTGAGFPASVTLACGSGLPSGSTCTFTSNPIPNMSGGPQSRTLAISTTARVTTTGSLLHRGPIFALLLPFLGVGLVGVGSSRKRRLLLGVFVPLLLGIALLQIGCSSSSTTSTTTGTPAGSYTVTVNATSGQATRTTTVQFTVE